MEREMSLTERLEKYRLVLKQLDICTKELVAKGVIGDRDAEKREKFVLEELTRATRLLGALGAPPVPKMPERERLQAVTYPGIAEDAGIHARTAKEPPGKANGAARV